ncbi:Pyruvate/Phosphoenolpyruvate kinase-like domain-containing protein [Mycena floridula]|nr:Pyruvate/Phosphoenolpyruvate kinase-like domain-containing protein [Mycena floridula]
MLWTLVQEAFLPPRKQERSTWVWKPFYQTANESVLVLVQIETAEGVQNVKDIAAVDGIDVLFIEPYDLSISLGYPPPSPDPHPEVEKIIQDVLKTAHAAGKKCAIYCTSGPQSALRAQ